MSSWTHVDKLAWEKTRGDRTVRVEWFTPPGLELVMMRSPEGACEEIELSQAAAFCLGDEFLETGELTGSPVGTAKAIQEQLQATETE